MRRRGAVIVILIAALAVRLALVAHTTDYRAINDPHLYLVLAGEVARTGDYAYGRGAGGTRGGTAYFPPGYPYFLAATDLLDGHRGGGTATVGPVRVVQAVLGTVTVALAGLVALELLGPGAGLITLALAAAYVPWIALGGTLVSENLVVALELAAIWAALRARRATRWRATWVTLAGFLTGLATLTHENLAVLVVPLAIAVWTGRPRWSVRSLAAPLGVILAAALTVAPWTIRNVIVIHRLVPVSDETGTTLAGTYNPVSARDARIPYEWRYYAPIPARQIRRMTEPELGGRLQSDAIDYIENHPSAPLAVAFHNTLRLLELEGSFAWKASFGSLDIRLSVARVAVIWFYLTAVLALIGATTRQARAIPGWFWLTALLLYLSVVFVNAETPRFRAAIDPFLLILAATALTAAKASATRA